MTALLDKVQGPSFIRTGGKSNEEVEEAPTMNNEPAYPDPAPVEEEQTSDLEPGGPSEPPDDEDDDDEDDGNPNKKWGVADFLEYRRALGEMMQGALTIAGTQQVRAFDEGYNPHATFGGVIAAAGLQLADAIRRAAKLTENFVPANNRKAIEEFAELASNSFVEIIGAVYGEERADEFREAIKRAEDENVRRLDMAEEQWAIRWGGYPPKAGAESDGMPQVEEDDDEEQAPESAILTYHRDDPTKGVN